MLFESHLIVCSKGGLDIEKLIIYRCVPVVREIVQSVSHGIFGKPIESKVNSTLLPVPRVALSAKYIDCSWLI